LKSRPELETENK